MNRRESLIALIAGASGGLVQRITGSIAAKPINKHRGVPTMEFVCDEHPLEILNELVNARNAKTFCGYAPGTLHFSGSSGTRQETGKWYLVVAFNEVKADSDTSALVNGHKVALPVPIYKRKDFSPLLTVGKRVS